MGYVLNAKHPNREHVMQNIRDMLDRLPVDKSFEVSIEPYHPEMTERQRRSMWGVAYKALMDQMGLRGAPAKDELHKHFCKLYFGEVQTKIDGFTLPVRSTTTDELGNRRSISVAEALDFYAYIQQYSAEHGMFVPDPDPLWREKARQEAEREAQARNA